MKRSWGWRSVLRAAVGALALLTATACTTSSPPTPEDEAATDADDWDAHRARFAANEVEVADLPRFDRYSVRISSPDPVVVRHGWFELTLLLGDRLELEQAGRYRSTSRYRLTTWDGALEAESVLARQDAEGLEEPARVHVCHDQRTGEVLLVEDHSWSLQRFILMHPAPGGARVSYVELPFLRPVPPHRVPEILGIRDGLLYARQDEVLYVYPLRELRDVDDLTYGIG